MKRKIIQLAGRTSVISLPSPWVQKYNLKKSQELDIIEKGRELIIRTDNFLGNRNVTVNINGLESQGVKWTLSGLHKSGYDEITLIYDNPKIINTIQEMVKDVMMGFVIMEQTSKKCVIKSIAQDLETEFESTLRRAFLVTRSLSQGLVGQIKNPESLKDLLELEKSNNQLTNFCERILNKQGYKDQNKTQFYYIIVWNLEKVCDEYRNICNFLSKNKLKVNKEVIELIKEVNDLFEEFYICFYQYSRYKINAFDRDKKLLLEKINKTEFNKSNLIVIYSLRNIISRISDFYTSTMALNTI